MSDMNEYEKYKKEIKQSKIQDGKCFCVNCKRIVDIRKAWHEKNQKVGICFDCY